MLTAKQLRAVELLLEGKMSLKQIASQVGVSESTLSRWKKDEAFSAFYAQGLRRVLNDAAAQALRTEMQILLHSDSDADSAAFRLRQLPAFGGEGFIGSRRLQDPGCGG